MQDILVIVLEWVAESHASFQENPLSAELGEICETVECDLDE